ncbi:MAG: hypothetical protein IJ379_02090 [Lachnospiraceae bacterium]|nr:hypothetical protein [Lachnospiraceae bacterium]
MEMEEKIIQTSKENDTPQFIKLGCENCGAALEMVDKSHAICNYCGQRYFIDENQEKLIVDVTVKHSSQDEQTRRALMMVMIALVIFLVVVVIVVVKICAYNAPAKEPEVAIHREVSFDYVNFKEL